jgi:hypothetical protein
MRRQLPIYPNEQTFSASVGMSQKCHKLTHAPQQKGGPIGHTVGVKTLAALGCGPGPVLESADC